MTDVSSHVGISGGLTRVITSTAKGVKTEGDVSGLFSGLRKGSAIIYYYLQYTALERNFLSFFKLISLCMIKMSNVAAIVE